MQFESEIRVITQHCTYLYTAILLWPRYFLIAVFDMSLVMFQAELKSLQDMASPSFLFAKDLIKHNLVSKTKNLKKEKLYF